MHLRGGKRQLCTVMIIGAFRADKRQLVQCTEKRADMNIVDVRAGGNMLPRAVDWRCG